MGKKHDSQYANFGWLQQFDNSVFLLDYFIFFYCNYGFCPFIEELIIRNLHITPIKGEKKGYNQRKDENQYFYRLRDLSACKSLI